jgi:hypothetical protein
MHSVRDFKRMMATKYGGLWRYMNEFVQRSENHRDFHSKLNRLGWERRTLEPEECSDVDATAFITEAEWHQLEDEFYKLLGGEDHHED